MSRTNIDIDDDLVKAVMERYGFTTKRQAVNYALRSTAVEPLGDEEAHGMMGYGWHGDLAEMRTARNWS